LRGYSIETDPLPSGEQTYKLVQLKELCDRLRHAYVDADDVHTAVHSLLKLLPSFTASSVQWGTTNASSNTWASSSSFLYPYLIRKKC
jgi:hypothetical protein